MSTTTKRKLNVRNTAMKSIERLVAEFDDLKVSSDKNERVIAIRDTINDKLLKIRDLNDEIMDKIEEEFMEDEEKTTTDFSIFIKERLREIEKFLSEETLTVTSSVARASVRLPKLDLKKFDGTTEHWGEFWDTFNHAIHENESISEVQKMTYLKTLVCGTAAQTIAGFKITSDNYSCAIQLLKERYENKHLQISLHMNNLLEVPPIKQMNHVEELRGLYNTIETQMRILKNLDIDDSMYGPFLVPILQRKVPTELNLIFSRHFHSKDSWDIKELLEQFKIELMAREKTKFTAEEESHPFTASSLTVHHDEKEKKLSCVFCNQAHRPQHCKIVTDVKSRKAILREKGRCFRCLRSGHLSRKCTSRIKCYTCQRSHHQSVCEGNHEHVKENPNYPVSKTQTKECTTNVVTSTDAKESFTNSFVASSNSTASVLLATAQADVMGESNKTTKARIFFDNGAQASYISPRLRQKLNLQTIENKEIVIKAFGNIITKETLEKVSIKIKTIDGSFEKIYCFVRDICKPITGQNTTLTATKYPHLRRLQLADSNEGESEIDLLIGSDYYWRFISGEVIRGDSIDDPVALKSKLGFILNGPTSVTNQTDSSTTMTSHVLKCETEIVDPDTVLDKHLNHFWTLETLEPNETYDELDILKDFRDNLTYDWEQGKYQVSLPFKNYHDLLPDNYSNCYKRLKGLQGRFSKDPELLKSYQNIIQDQLESGVIEPVPESEIKAPGQVHYLPHRPVVHNDRKTTKVRMVYDASSKTNGVSLNDCLNPGPSLTESLFGVLLRFRTYKYAFTADIEKAFLQILLSNPDKDFVRFLWYKYCPDFSDGTDESTPTQIYRLCRVLFGANSSPFLLSATLIEHFNQLPDKNFVEKVLKSLHVDDLISGDDTETGTLQLYQQTKDHLSLASFNLRKFQSNSNTLSHVIHGPEHSCEQKSKVLGLTWDKFDDDILFCFDHLYKLAFEVPTKRQLLAFMASIYDPLGLLNPFIVKLKILFQRVCVEKVGWDCQISDQCLSDWKVIRHEFSNCDVIRFDRWYHTSKSVDRVEIHGFSDASLRAYGGCVFLKVISHDDVFVSLVSAKSRVAPAKSSTIPKLELMGALLLSKLLNRVMKEFTSFVHVDDCFCWTDSMVTLHWISDTKKSYHTFVKRRVDKIRSFIPPDHWLHINTKSNPADILSRGVSISQLVTENLWRHGPEFLKSLHNYDQYKLCNLLVDYTTLTVAVQEEISPTPISSKLNVFEVVDIERFNDIGKLTRVTAYVRRFINNLQLKRKHCHSTLSSLSVTELRQSTDTLVKSCQRNITTDANYEQLKRDLRLYNDQNGVIRCRGRLENADLPYDTKFPIFIPKSKFASLIVYAAHEKVKHNGIKETLNETRTQFWVPKARNFVKSIIRNCRLCKLLESKPYGYPSSPPLPTSRVSVHPPFTFSAIDYAGPVHVKAIYSDSSDTHKAWIVLYTCHATRAICLDLVPSYDADSCIRTLRRFFSRRGVPSSMLSDNGTNFSADETQRFVTALGVQWNFNPPASPWWGGMFERLIRSTKRCLRKILLRAKLDYEELTTVLFEVETVINNRPLTFTYEEPGSEVVTPNHLLFGRRLNLHGTAETDNGDIEENSNQRLRYVKTLIQSFWSRWKNEYLTELREHHRKSTKNRDGQCKIGDVVLIQEDNCPRISFRTGIVESFKPSRDNKVRAATVRYVKNDRVLKITRPICKLFPIEQNENGSDHVDITFISDHEIAEIF